MNFKTKEWRRMYDKIQKLGGFLKDSLPTIDENKVVHPPLRALSKEAQLGIRREIDDTTTIVRNYLDACGKKMPEPLWKYNKDDKTTWASHETFIYQHYL